MLKHVSSILFASVLLAFAADAAETNTPTPKESNDMKPTATVEEDIITLTTSEGVIVIKLDSVNCPKHA
ncbi:MAG: hypothetical protein EB056_02430, partial [Verrucomicrobia bacterium]|nr:hypothetical protein [Verrucomicrobiota bacterium]